MNLIKLIGTAFEIISKAWNKLFVSPVKRSMLGKCGKNVIINRRVYAMGWDNIFWEVIFLLDRMPCLCLQKLK